MKTIDIIKTLEAISSEKEIHSGLLSLINTLKQDYKLEIVKETKGTTMVKRTKKAINYLNKMSKHRPILGCCDIQNINGIDYQVFTNSYTCCCLCKEDYMELKSIEQLREDNDFRDAKFPEVSRLLLDGIEDIKISYSKLKLSSKLKQDVKIQVSENNDRYADSCLLMELVDIMGITDDFIINTTINENIINIKNDKGSTAILLLKKSTKQDILQLHYINYLKE